MFEFFKKKENKKTPDMSKIEEIFGGNEKVTFSGSVSHTDAVFSILTNQIVAKEKPFGQYKSSPAFLSYVWNLTRYSEQDSKEIIKGIVDQYEAMRVTYEGSPELQDSVKESVKKAEDILKKLL